MFKVDEVRDWETDGPTLSKDSVNAFFAFSETVEDEVSHMKGPITATLEVNVIINDEGSPGTAESTTQISQVWTNFPFVMLNELHGVVANIYAMVQSESAEWGDSLQEAIEQSGGNKDELQKIVGEQLKQRRQERRKNRPAR